MKINPLLMESYFEPGFRTLPAVFVGSQTVEQFHGNAQEQAWEGFVLSGASAGDVVVVRDFDNEYIKYLKKLLRGVEIINLENSDKGEYLTKVILEDENVVEQIKQVMDKQSTLIAFLPTKLEEELAKKLEIPLHGSSRINDLYGTKSGIRKLSHEAKISMAPGYICNSYKEFQEAIYKLREKFDFVAVKHDLSLSGYFSKKISTKPLANFNEELNKIVGGKFIEWKDIVVVEGWIKSKASLCAHIEIEKDKDPVICAAWQQVIDSDGISYRGAGPLTISEKAFKSFTEQAKKLGIALKNKGAVGSFGPDFLIVGDDETNLEPGTSVLVELNARAPYTAYPLQLIKNIKGTVGNGFYTKHIKLKENLTFTEIREILEKSGLLITEEGVTTGVIPHNIGLLPWKLFDILAIGNSWEEVVAIMKEIDRLFNQMSI